MLENTECISYIAKENEAIMYLKVIAIMFSCRHLIKKIAAAE
jgi:hypothetical protein